jgi:hypothetical protein
MTQTSPTLQALLTSLTNQKRGTSLTLDESTLTGTAAASLFELFTDQLEIHSFRLDDASLPPSVTGTTFQASGHSGDVFLDLTFEDVGGEVAIEALFHAAALAPLQQAFPSLSADFFGGIEISDTAASVSVPGLATLTLTSPVYGVIGRVTPAGGLVMTSVAPRVDGQAAAKSGPQALAVELQTATTAYRIAPPPTNAWTFDDLSTLTKGLAILDDAIGQTMLKTDELLLRGFELNLDANAPSLSSLSLDVAHSDDGAGQGTALWAPLDGRVQLTDVVVQIDLTYSNGGSLSLAGTGSVEGKFLLAPDAADPIPLDVQIPFPATGIWSLTAFPNVPLTALDHITSLLPVKTSPQDLLPAGLADLGSFEFTYIRIAVNVGKNPSLAEFTVGFGSSSPWTLIPGSSGSTPAPALELTALQILLTIDAEASVTGEVVGMIELATGSEIVISFGRSTPQSSWRLDVISPAIALPGLGDLASLARGQDLASLVKVGGLDRFRFVMTNLNVGIAFSPTRLTDLGLTLQLADADTDKPLDPTLDWDLIPGVLTLTQFSFGFQIDWVDAATAKTHAPGTFVLNDLEFDVNFFATGASPVLIAEYSAQGPARPVEIKSLIDSISHTVATYVPAGLEIDVSDGMLAYLGTGPKYLLALDVSAEVQLSDLPLVGEAFPASLMAGLKSLKVVVASDSITVADVGSINATGPKSPLPAPAQNATSEAIPKGVSMIAELEIGSLVVRLATPPTTQQTPQTTPSARSTSLVPRAAAAATTAQDAAAVLPPPAAPGLWKDVGLSIGPVQLRRVGIAWVDGRVWLLLDAGLAAGGLTVDLQGLGLGFTPTDPPKPAGVLHGLAVALQAGPVDIAGGLIEVDTTNGTEYDGEILVEFEQLQLSALGSWSTVDGAPSLFVFALLNDPPLGGPGFFFVTGLAFGFGYNRSLELPTLEALPQFPFVAAAMAGTAPGSGSNPFSSTDPTQALQVLAKQPSYVPPTIGEDWLAAGVRFTSFELLQSFALLTVEFGRDFQIALLGLSTLAAPAQVDEPLAFAELALEGSFASDTGLVAISAQLTPESYVMSKACRLTGGFAFYLWTKDAQGQDAQRQPRAGEFVVTLGGYNPRFVPPAGYPAVPRIGATWQVDELVVKAGLYFALTPSCLMAGGSLEATWDSGDIHVTFTAEADFLLGWKPFQYNADASITLTGQVTIDVIVTITITFHVGAWLNLSGPPFGGTAHVDLDVVSFTVQFGDEPAQKTTAWSEFTASFLPADTKSWCGARVLGGLERDLTRTGGDVDWIVNGEQLVLETFTVVPSSSATISIDGSAADQVKDDLAPFGVGPVGLDDGQLSSTHEIVVTRLGGDGDKDVKLADRLHVVPATAAQPRALWSKAAAINPTIDGANQPATLPDMLMGGRIQARAVAPDTTPAPVAVSTLQDEAESTTAFAWSAAPKPGPAQGDFAKSLGDPTVAGERTAIVAILAAAGADLPAAPEASRLAASVGLMSKEPHLAEVGS